LYVVESSRAGVLLRRRPDDDRVNRAAWLVDVDEFLVV